ncbi:Uncharacterised protein [Vibrio cholerae]|nr:Uncharacterised protein [Vibrio cholerae]
MQGETTGLNRVAREERTSLCSSSLSINGTLLNRQSVEYSTTFQR